MFKLQKIINKPAVVIRPQLVSIVISGSVVEFNKRKHVSSVLGIPVTPEFVNCGVTGHVAGIPLRSGSVASHWRVVPFPFFPEAVFLWTAKISGSRHPGVLPRGWHPGGSWGCRILHFFCSFLLMSTKKLKIKFINKPYSFAMVKITNNKRIIFLFVCVYLKN